MIESSDCPISGTKGVRVSATDELVECDCPMCGRFRVSRTALALAGDNDQVVLFDALKAAKAAASFDEVPLITNLSG